MNPRHAEFLALAYPDGHRGWAGQTGHVYAADGTTPLEREEMPTMRAGRGEVLHDYLIWVGPEPGQRRALAVSSTPHYAEDGTFAGAVLAYHDITDLVTAVRIKDEFVASVSHELRTPLTSIIGYVDVLLDDVEGLRGRAASTSRPCNATPSACTDSSTTSSRVRSSRWPRCSRCARSRCRGCCTSLRRGRQGGRRRRA